MIHGTATMEINEATMIVAVQEFLDRRISTDNPVKVTAVEAQSPTYGSKTFKINFQEPNLKPHPLSNSQQAA